MCHVGIIINAYTLHFLQLKQILLSNTMTSTDVVVVKVSLNLASSDVYLAHQTPLSFFQEYLPDGSPFFPIMRRQLVSNFQAKKSAMDIPKRKPSIIAQSQGST